MPTERTETRTLRLHTQSLQSVTENLRLSLVAARETSSDTALVDGVERTRVRFAELYGNCLAAANVPTSEVVEFESLVSECLLGLEEGHAKETWKRQSIERLRFYQKVCHVLRDRGVKEAKALVGRAVKSLRSDKANFGLEDVLRGDDLKKSHMNQR